MADEETPKLNQMWFHPVNGSYIVCHTVAEIPEGFINRFGDCSDPVTDRYEGPYKCTDFTVPDTAKKAVSKKVPEKAAPEKAAPEKKKAAPKPKAKKAAPASKAPTLKKLELSRSEAIALLNEDNVKFNPKATDGTIAAMVSKLIEDDED